MDGYRKGGATPICMWSPAQSGSWDMLHVGLEHIGYTYSFCFGGGGGGGGGVCMCVI